MAVTTTPRQVITAAYGYSLKNRPGALGTENSELLELVHRAIEGLYAVAARVNPTFFAESAVVPFASGGWARPETAEAVWRIELADGTEVEVVPYDDRAAEPESPCVYRYGQVYRPARAIAPDPQSGDLTFFYARRPTKATGLDTALDSQWVEGHNGLLMLEAAIYFAIKDGRGEERQALTETRAPLVAQYVAFLEHETANEVRRFGNIRTFNAPSLVSLTQLLAGGTP